MDFLVRCPHPPCHGDGYAVPVVRCRAHVFGVREVGHHAARYIQLKGQAVKRILLERLLKLVGRTAFVVGFALHKGLRGLHQECRTGKPPCRGRLVDTVADIQGHGDVDGDSLLFEEVKIYIDQHHSPPPRVF